MTETTRVTVGSSVYTRTFEGEIVLLNFSSGEYFALDEVGTLVWQGCESGESMQVIAKRIVERYEVAYEEALRDILVLVTQLREKNLVTVIT